jgi:aconitate hydratase 2/2-methylisocitrate dehydratase
MPRILLTASADAIFLLDLLANRVPPGVDESAYVKAAFLSAVAKKEAISPILSKERATELLSTMQVTILRVLLH